MEYFQVILFSRIYQTLKISLYSFAFSLHYHAPRQNTRPFQWEINGTILSTGKFSNGTHSPGPRIIVLKNCIVPFARKFSSIFPHKRKALQV